MAYCAVKFGVPLPKIISQKEAISCHIIGSQQREEMKIQKQSHNTSPD
jgi:hypothetical protein